ncbi:MAG: SDR family oxidoreductase [Geodermatophilaceae bacterium]|jgi:3-oxoacyl-[acyl-carrier protein] reductase|nr:SDR family oxidoreductase [Geodermatophilaceae bacterium]
MSTLEGRSAIVTGGGQGLGWEYAKRLLLAGASVAVVDVVPEAVAAAADTLGRNGRADRVLAHTCDVTDEEAVAAMVSRVTETWSGPLILINNAGGAMLPSQPMESFSRAEWDHVLGVNLTGAWLCAKAIVPAMRTEGYGKIINISSTMVSKGWPIGLAPYIAAKAGVVGLTRALAKELGPDGIRVNAIAPGYVPVSTKKTVHKPEAAIALRERIAGEQCLPRTQVPEDLCGPIEFLSSAESDFVTGQVINVDGGWVFD